VHAPPATYFGKQGPEIEITVDKIIIGRISHKSVVLTAHNHGLYQGIMKD